MSEVMKAETNLDTGEVTVAGGDQGGTPETTQENQAATANSQEAPEGVPEKFRGEDGGLDTEKLLRSYSELEKAFSKRRAEPSDEETGTPAAAAAEEEAGSSVESLSIKSDPVQEFTFDQLVDKQFAGNELTPEETAWLGSRGIPVEAVAGAVSARQQAAGAVNSEIVEAVGGPDVYRKVADWAKANLNETEVAEFNALTDNPAANKVAIKNALKGMKAQMEAYTASPVFGGSSGPTGVQPFASRDEQFAAQRDPRYRTDEKYRKEVIARVAVSNY